MRMFISVLSLVSLAQAAPAFASSSAWFEAAGGRVRLITAGHPDDRGIIQGALQVDLAPGWTTYWLDPGDSGVPPSLDVTKSTNVASADMSFPPPHRYDDGSVKWAGYNRPVTFPVAFTLSDKTGAVGIQADVFLGICETICVPLQATLTLDPASDPDNAKDAGDIQAALDALPGPEQPDFGVTLLSGGKEEVLVEAAFAGDPASVDFFLAGTDGYFFGPPVRRQDGEKLIFSVPILERPGHAPDKGGLHYTLVTDAGAVAGMLPYPPAP